MRERQQRMPASPPLPHPSDNSMCTRSLHVHAIRGIPCAHATKVSVRMPRSYGCVPTSLPAIAHATIPCARDLCMCTRSKEFRVPMQQKSPCVRVARATMRTGISRVCTNSAMPVSRACNISRRAHAPESSGTSCPCNNFHECVYTRSLTFLLHPLSWGERF